MALHVPSKGPLPVGERVPDFKLVAASKEGYAEFSLSAHLRGKPIVLSFFPMAFTRVCTAQMCEMRDRAEDLSSLDAQVFGFSGDTPAVNRAFAKANDLKHPILSDPDFAVLPEIWRLQTVAGVANRAHRGVMIVGGDGAVRWTHLHETSGEWIGLDAIAKQLG